MGFKPIFRSIREIFRPAPQLARPFGLSAEEVIALGELHLEKGWQVYERVLDEQSILLGESLLASRDAYTDTYLKGVIAGLRRSGTLVDEIAAKEQEIARAADRNSAKRQPSESARIAATYGTPAWRGTGSAGPSRP